MLWIWTIIQWKWKRCTKFYFYSVSNVLQLTLRALCSCRNCRPARREKSRSSRCGRAILRTTWARHECADGSLLRHLECVVNARRGARWTEPAAQSQCDQRAHVARTARRPAMAGPNAAGTRGQTVAGPRPFPGPPWFVRTLPWEGQVHLCIPWPAACAS